MDKELKRLINERQRLIDKVCIGIVDMEEAMA